jgi:hypothetical protein
MVGPRAGLADEVLRKIPHPVVNQIPDPNINSFYYVIYRDYIRRRDTFFLTV